MTLDDYLFYEKLSTARGEVIQTGIAVCSVSRETLKLATRELGEFKLVVEALAKEGKELKDVSEKAE